MSGTVRIGVRAVGVLAVLAGEASGQVQVLPLPVHPVYGQMEPRRVSGDGDVVVGFGRTNGPVGLVWTISTNTLEVVPASVAGTRHTLSGVSYDGSVVAGTCNGPSGQTGFRWTRGGAVELLTGQNGAPRMFSANTLSSDGLTAGGDTPSGSNRASIWTPGIGTRVLAGPPGMSTRHVDEVSADGGTVVGILTNQLPFVWREETGSFLVPTPPGMSNAYRLAMTAMGDAIYGMAGSSTPGQSAAFTWNAETGTTVIPNLEAYRVTVQAANEDGRLVVGKGVALSTEAQDAATIHTFGVGTVTLAEYLAMFGAEYAPADFTEAISISALGNVIVGKGGLHPFWVVIIPPLGVSDFNADAFTDFHDLDAYLDCFEGLGPLPVSSADLNRDGITDFFDLIEFIDHF